MKSPLPLSRRTIYAGSPGIRQALLILLNKTRMFPYIRRYRPVNKSFCPLLSPEYFFNKAFPLFIYFVVRRNNGKQIPDSVIIRITKQRIAWRDGAPYK